MSRDELAGLTLLGMQLPLDAWLLLGAPAGLGFALFILAQATALIAGGWALWQMLRVLGDAGDTYYRRFTRKHLSKEYRDS